MEKFRFDRCLKYLNAKCKMKNKIDSVFPKIVEEEHEQKEVPHPSKDQEEALKKCNSCGEFEIAPDGSIGIEESGVGPGWTYKRRRPEKS